jgi:FkbM family methyltransferase
MPPNPAPAMVPILVAAGAFSREPFTLVDVGARGGVKDHWRAFGDDLRVIGFEPHPEEFRRLQTAKADTRTMILPFGLGGSDEVRTLHIHRNPSSSSLFVEDPEFIARMMLREAFAVVDHQPIELRRLDGAVGDAGVDFIELDAEGAELEIMRAGTTILGRTLGVFTEVRFHEGFQTPLFAHVDVFLRDLGFSLYDLSYSRESRRALPYPLSGDFRADGDRVTPIFGATTGGQPAYGDALFLRDLVAQKAKPSITRVLKAACLFEIYGQNDSAAELILAHQESVSAICDPRMLLDALVPVVAKRKMPYEEYVRRYFAQDPIFRPQPDLWGQIHELARTLALMMVRGERGRRFARACLRAVNSSQNRARSFGARRSPSRGT